MKRMTKQQEHRATDEMLEIILKRGRVRTSELVGTPHFHGEKTLSLAQVRRLLRKTGIVEMDHCGQYHYQWGEWHFKRGE